VPVYKVLKDSFLTSLLRTIHSSRLLP
jgi:hypothetical protein